MSKNIIMSLFSSILYIIMSSLTVACSMSSSAKCQSALDAGNLKEAELFLKEIKDSRECRHYGGLLIDEYLAIGNLDRAIYVFERITGHCSMYNMKYKGLYDSAAYTEKYSRKIYDALIKDGRYDEAWNYHARNYENEDYAGNAPDYFSYMSDVIVAMCNSGQQTQALQFIKQKSVWFIKNVDNSYSVDDYLDYRYDIMRSQLFKVLNDSQY